MRFFAAIGALAICLCVALVAYLLGGFYDVAASQKHFDIVAWSLHHISEASIERHSGDSNKATLATSETSLIQKGAHEFVEEGCIDCHGGPGVEPDKFSRGMRPHPPDLGHVAAHADASEIYWVVKHGIKMTGMPAFGGHIDQDELRAIVAFVKGIKKYSTSEFRDLTKKTGQEPAEAANKS